MLRLQYSGGCADPGDTESASKQDRSQQEPSDSKMENGVSRTAQAHTVRAEAGPEVHVDKAAGIVSITGLPLGCRFVTILSFRKPTQHASPNFAISMPVAHAVPAAASPCKSCTISCWFGCFELLQQALCELHVHQRRSIMS